MKEVVVVIGNGMVGHRFCERLHELDTEQRFEIVVFGEERRAAYDRVRLSDFFAGAKASELALTTGAWYAERGMRLLLGEAVLQVSTERRELYTTKGRIRAYDHLVFATGSTPFVPPIEGIDQRGVFVYRTVEDLEAIAAWGRGAKRAAVIGGGLLGLEAAKAMCDMGLETSVIEASPRLLPRQVDAAGGAVLRRAIEALGVDVRLEASVEAIAGEAGRVSAVRFRQGVDLPVDIVVVSTGIRPRDDLARAAGLAIGPRGGIVVDDGLATSAKDVYAIGECALHGGSIYGLVGPGYEMADVLASRLLVGASAPRSFTGADLSTKLKLLGVDVASFGDAFADEGSDARSVVFHDVRGGVYQKLVLDASGERLLGGVLVGDASRYFPLLQLARSRDPIACRPEELLFGARSEVAAELADDAQICSCNAVSKGALCSAIRERALATVADVKAATRAGTGCGGCVPQLQQILHAELARAGLAVDRSLCEHFAYTRQQLFEIVKLGRVESFEALLASHGTGHGCEVCRPAVASILAATWNDPILDHASIQDTNDRFLANVQRGGTYSVVPRVPGGEITPERLIVLGEVARKYDLYCKITGGQRIDLLGARVDQLPDIWADLVAAGFESGHAYGKAMRTVKSCVGSTWCRYGVQDSVAFSIRIEERYRGLRAPHKLKSAVSGCIRECAEAQSKDFGIIATEKGWNLYVCGNGGSKPRHAELLASDVDDDRCIQLIDRFLMYYIRTANSLERTARWLERLEGGLDYLRSVVVDDALGIAAQLERDMQELVDGYECEWAAVVRDPERQRQFRHFAQSREADPSLAFVRERGQRRPADWPGAEAPALARPASDEALRWVRLARASDVPRDGGINVHYGAAQIAVFHFASRGEWYATQAMCPHRKDMVLARGLLGTQGDEPKVACPLHKKTFSLRTGCGLSDPTYAIRAFRVELRGDDVYAELPPEEALAPAAGACSSHPSGPSKRGASSLAA